MRHLQGQPSTVGAAVSGLRRVQVFVCDGCDDRVQPRDGDVDDELWQRAIDESAVSRAMFLTYAE